MTPRGPTPTFLARSAYRQRRLRDVARIVPILGTILFLIPLMLVPEAGEAGPRSVPVVIYIFAVWAGLVLVAAILSQVLLPDTEAESDDGQGPA